MLGSSVAGAIWCWRKVLTTGTLDLVHNPGIWNKVPETGAFWVFLVVYMFNVRF